MIKRIGRVCAISLLALAPGVVGSIHAAASSACTAWTDPANDDTPWFYSNGAALDLLEGTLSTSPSGDTLQVRMSVRDMSTAVPLGATGVTWETDFATERGDYFFIRAEVSVTGQQVFTDEANTNVEAAGAHSDAGVFVAGPGGYVEIDVPFSHLGISQGSILSQITALTYNEVGQPGLVVDDAAAPSTFAVGASC